MHINGPSQWCLEWLTAERDESPMDEIPCETMYIYIYIYIRIIIYIYIHIDIKKPYEYIAYPFKRFLEGELSLEGDSMTLFFSLHPCTE